MAVNRTARLNELVKRALSTIIQKEYSTSAIGWVTVSRVVVSKDIQHARVFFTVMGGDEQRALARLIHAGPHLRHLLAQSVRLRSTPELIFEIDTELKQALKVDAIIDEAKKQLHGTS